MKSKKLISEKQTEIKKYILWKQTLNRQMLDLSKRYNLTEDHQTPWKHSRPGMTRKLGKCPDSQSQVKHKTYRRSGRSFSSYISRWWTKAGSETCSSLSWQPAGMAGYNGRISREKLNSLAFKLGKNVYANKQTESVILTSSTEPLRSTLLGHCQDICRHSDQPRNQTAASFGRKQTNKHAAHMYLTHSGITSTHVESLTWRHWFYR